MGVAAASQVGPVLAEHMQAAVACTVVQQGAAMLEHAESLLERIAQLVGSVAEVEVLALEHSLMWEQDRDHTSRRRPTSMLAVAEISKQCVHDETSPASSPHAVF